MGKYSDFPSQTPQVRPKSANYTPKRDDEHPCHFYMWCYSHKRPPISVFWVVAHGAFDYNRITVMLKKGKNRMTVLMYQKTSY